MLRKLCFIPRFRSYLQQKLWCWLYAASVAINLSRCQLTSKSTHTASHRYYSDHISLYVLFQYDKNWRFKWNTWLRPSRFDPIYRRKKKWIYEATKKRNTRKSRKTNGPSARLICNIQALALIFNTCDMFDKPWTICYWIRTKYSINFFSPFHFRFHVRPLFSFSFSFLFSLHAFACCFKNLHSKL